MERQLDIIPVSEWGFFDESIPPIVVAGPCSAESELQVMTTARELHDFGIHVFRAGIWKPRTHPGCFEGIGSPGLKWLQRVQRELGMKVCTEVASEKHVYECVKYGIDMVWIGARTTSNPFLVQEIADALRDTEMPVLVKNPINPDLGLWVGALERLNQAGIRKLGVIHYKFNDYEIATADVLFHESEKKDSDKENTVAEKIKGFRSLIFSLAHTGAHGSIYLNILLFLPLILAVSIILCVIFFIRSMIDERTELSALQDAPGSRPVKKNCTIPAPPTIVKAVYPLAFCRMGIWYLVLRGS